MARLAPGVVQRIGLFQETLGAIEPEQYYYPATDIHVTVLSLLTAAEHNQEQLAQAGAFIPAVEAALSGVRTFRLETVGVTLTSTAVLAQGFPEADALTPIRERIRETLKAQGLGEGLTGATTSAPRTIRSCASPRRCARRSALGRL